MRQLLIITTFLSSMIMSSVAYAKWTEIGKNVGETIYFVDLERSKKHSGKIYYWMIVDYLKHDASGTISHQSYYEAECGRFRYRNLSGMYYKDRMASGEVISSNNTPDKDWTYPPPNSVIESVLTAVCNHKTMQ